MQVLTVSELTSAIKSILEPPFRGISVKGEISNFKAQSSGHLYFTLKDEGAQISAVLFKGNAAFLSKMPKEGDQVIAKGEISLYAPRGQYQIVIRELQFLGMGELLLRFQQLKEKMQAKGWFDAAYKKKLPKLPARIGIVTSPTGAVIQDMLHILSRRFAGLRITLIPVKVQGEGAALEIARAIDEFNARSLADVLIIGRGGGSIEDLWAFNEEIVAEAIFRSNIPIISAVGHETDFTIADWVADVRAPTPSAAAEIVIAEKAHLLKNLLAIEQTLRYRLLQQIRQNKERLSAIYKHPMLSSPYSLLSHPIQQLDAIRSNLETLKPLNQIRQWKTRLAPLPNRFASAVQLALTEKRQKLERVWGHLCSVNPRNVLKKGYAILFAGDNPIVVLSAKDINHDQPFTALLHDGRIHATATRIDSNG